MKEKKIKFGIVLFFALFLTIGIVSAYNFTSIANSCFNNATRCEYGSDLIFATYTKSESEYSQFNYTYNFTIPDNYAIVNVSANTTISNFADEYDELINLTIYCNTTFLKGLTIYGNISSYSNWNGTEFVINGLGTNASYNIPQSCVEGNKINLIFNLNTGGFAFGINDNQFFYSLEGTIPEEEIEEQLSYLDTSTYKVMEGSGAGLGLFIDYLIQPLFYLLIIIVFVGLIGVIGYALASVINRMIK